MSEPAIQNPPAKRGRPLKPQLCACTRPGIKKKGNEWVCEFCDRAESLGCSGGPRSGERRATSFLSSAIEPYKVHR